MVARLVPLGPARLLLAGCSKPLAPSYCEYSRVGEEGDCVAISAAKDADPTAVGVVQFKSRPSASTTFVHRASRKKLALHRDGKLVGEIIQGDDDWIVVTLTSDGEPPYSKRMRSEPPGGVFE